MVQQDNKPNNETTVDGRPIRRFRPGISKVAPTIEYVDNDYLRDDDPLLSPEERANTRGNILGHSVDKERHGDSHPG